MIDIRLLYKDGEPAGFTCEGHALYADEGQDIICSAVSALTINTVNSIEQFTDDEAEVIQDEDGGFLSFTLKSGPSREAELLLNSLFLGLGMIEETYGIDYLNITEYDQVIS